MSRFTPKLLFLAALATSGCATSGDFHVDNRKAYYSGNTELAIAKIDRAIKEHPEEADFLKLDRAMVMLSDGHPKEAELLLKEVRDRWDEEDLASNKKGSQKLSASDIADPYAPEAYEKVMISVMLSLCNLLTDGTNAESYALEANQKHQSLVNPNASNTSDGEFGKPYRTVPIAEYISGVLQEASHSRFDEAAKSYENCSRMMCDPESLKLDISRTKNGRHCDEGNGVVYVFILSGRGPRKYEESSGVGGDDVEQANQILQKIGKKSLFSQKETVKIIRPKWTNNYFMGFDVDWDGKNSHHTSSLLSVDKLESSLLVNDTIARAIVRKESQKSVVADFHEMNAKVRDRFSKSALNFANFVEPLPELKPVGCWGILPAEIHAIRIELPAGEHNLSMRFTGGGFGFCGQFTAFEYSPVFAPGQDKFGPVKLRVEKGQNTYVLANHVGDRFVGKIATNKPAK